MSIDKIDYLFRTGFTRNLLYGNKETQVDIPRSKVKTATTKRKLLMENITLTALKELYKTEFKKLELMKEYIAEKEAVRYSIAVDILREVKKDREEETVDFDQMEMSQLAEDKLDDFFRRDEDMINVDYKGSLEYDLQKAFILKIENRLQEEYGLVPAKNVNGTIVFKKIKK
jgi:hypothetical protein